MNPKFAVIEVYSGTLIGLCFTKSEAIELAREQVDDYGEGIEIFVRVDNSHFEIL